MLRCPTSAETLTSITANLQLRERLGPFIRGKIRRELYHLYEHVLSNKPRLILDEMCRLYGKFASYFSSYKWPYCFSWFLRIHRIV